ncbi:MAG: transglycosylase SLT domain-containing protein [Blastocatellia bacterium]
MSLPVISTLSSIDVNRSTSRPWRAPATPFSSAQNFSHTFATEPPPDGSSEPSQARLQEVLRERTLAEMKAILLALQTGANDPEQLTDLIFYARHPELIETPLTSEQRDLVEEWNNIQEQLVSPTLEEFAQLSVAFQHDLEFPAPASHLGQDEAAAYDQIIAQAVGWCPGLAPEVLKSLLAQESAFNPHVINQYGYAGIAQLGRSEAREAGLQVGVAGSRSDERLQPDKAIPAAARLLHNKAQRLQSLAFARYGQPRGIEFWKFTLAAYNGGEGTISLAMGNAHRKGLAIAQQQGLTGMEALSFARQYATKWENLQTGGLASPLGQAAAVYFPRLANTKYHEIGNYPAEIVRRAAVYS